MKISITAILFFCFSLAINAQEIQTLFSNKDTSKSVPSGNYGKLPLHLQIGKKGRVVIGGYGAPLIQATHINGNIQLQIGGRGGVVINKKFAFGGVGMGLVPQYKFKGDNLKGNLNAPLRLSMGAGGVFFEYIYKLRKPVHFSVPVHFMVGGVSIREDSATTNSKSKSVKIESTTIFIIEPGINLEFNVSKYFILGVHVSYRQVLGGDLVNMNQQQLSGVNAGLNFKFGIF